VTVVDRNPKAGGTLRSATDEKVLPRAVLDAEIAQLEKLGIEFKPGVELGRDVTIEGLLRGFNAILIATGQCEGDQPFGLERSGGFIKADPNSCETKTTGVFAAGAAVKTVKQLVRAMFEGKMAAQCTHQFLSGKVVRRPDKPFSSIMGRLELAEVKTFLQGANVSGTVSPCNACAGYNRAEASTEASRCLHCDCRSSGNCRLQFYAQTYGADASRFRAQRRMFEQHRQPGGILFEPGKCILCGICVKLTEMAAEPLGLTFIGRGFDVRVAAPFNREIEEGLQKVAAECVEHCPTGALVFADKSKAAVI
jgi:ferredoxin